MRKLLLCGAAPPQVPFIYNFGELVRDKNIYPLLFISHFLLLILIYVISPLITKTLKIKELAMMVASRGRERQYWRLGLPVPAL